MGAVGEAGRDPVPFLDGSRGARSRAEGPIAEAFKACSIRRRAPARGLSQPLPRRLLAETYPDVKFAS